MTCILINFNQAGLGAKVGLVV